MCGIIGFNFKSENEEIFTISNHRGPDNTFKVEVGSFTLGHNRLSIVDHDELSNQPMTSECGRYSIVFNGEVYNHPEIRNKLKDKYKFKTLSDTEAILYSYIEYGENCVELLRGMFAFAIYDKELDKLFCVRDRIGIKPFLYYFQNGKFIFASEINVILEALEGYIPKINNQAIAQYIKYLYIPCPNTIFQNIMKLPPGYSLSFQNGKLEIKKYWDVEDYTGKNSNMNEEQILKKLDTLFDESIKMRMIADVELGSFLSGGIDSSLILYYMNKNSKTKINTYTLGFKDAKRYDETSDAKIMSDFFSTNHKEIIIEPNAVELLPKMVKHFGEPFASPTSLLIHELTNETKKIATVALAGDGGDEVFGGYPKYEATIIADKLKFIPKGFWKILNVFIKALPESTEGNHTLRRIKTFLTSLEKEPSSMYDDWSSYISDEDINNLFKNDIKYEKVVQKIWSGQKQSDGVLNSSIVDLKTYLPNDMLYYGDIMSMANSFEVRFPLIDHKIVEFMTSIDSKWRIKDGKTKYLMKKLLKDKIPDAIIEKKKLGLNPPMGIWLRKDLKDLISEYLSKSSIDKRGIFNYNFIEKILYEFENNKKDRSLNIWALIVLEEWFRQYIDKSEGRKG